MRKGRKNTYSKNSNLDFLNGIIVDKIGSLVLITFITIFLTSFFVKKINENTTFKSISTLDGSRGYSFDLITNLENNFNSFLLKDNTLPDAKKKIQNINYFDLYIKSLNKELFIKLFKENNFLNKEDYTSDTNYLEALSDLYDNNIELRVEKRIVFQNQVINSVWSLRFAGPIEKKKQWEEILKKLNKESNKKLKEKIVKSIDAKLVLVNNLIDNDIQLIENKLSFFLKDHFDYKNQELLVYLKEQTSLARELNIANGLEYLRGSDISKMINLFDDRGPEFLSFQWGYIALEKKIEEVSARSYNNAKYYVNEYEGLMNRKNELVQAKVYYNKLYNDSLKNSSFFTDEITEEIFEVSTQISTKTINSFVNILLNILVVITANIIFIAILALKNKKNNFS